MGRWLGIDHGTRRIGIAVGDAVSKIASPLEPPSTGHQEISDRVAALSKEYQARGVVVGWPINANGTEGRQGRLAREFAAALAERTGLDVRLWDERLSSFQADEHLKGQFTRKKKRRRHDAVAAAAILADFLAHNGPELAPTPAAAQPERAEQ